MENKSNDGAAVPMLPGDKKVQVFTPPLKSEDPPKGSVVRQVIAALASNLGAVGIGMTFGFSAVALPQLEDAASEIPIDKYQAAWIASLSSVATPIGCLIGGNLMDRLGRRTTLILLAIPSAIGWLTMAFAYNLIMLYVGRLLTGLGAGMATAPSRVYTGEISQPHLRGTLTGGASVCVSFGVFLQYLMGSILPWRVFTSLSAFVPLLALLLMALMPESPTWLVNRGRHQEAGRALKRLRGNSMVAAQELSDLIKQQEVLLASAPPPSSFKEILVDIMKPSALKPFGIIATYFFIYQFSGVNAITFYAVSIFVESGVEVNKYLATLILGVIRLVGTILSCGLLRYCGRRPLTMISCVGCTTCIASLGTYLTLRDYWKSQGIEPVATWVPLACILTFMGFVTIGFLMVPWVMVGEVFPTRVRGTVGGATTCSAHIFIFTVVKTFPLLEDAVGTAGTFWFYAIINIFGGIFLYVFLPETKGRPLSDIEDYFSGRTKSIGNSKVKKRCPCLP